MAKETIENRHLVELGSAVKLADHDPADTGGMAKDEARQELAGLVPKLNELQQLLYATQQYALLIVLQGMDTSGKDGVVTHVVGTFNPQGCIVTPFKVPTADEAAHDFLWRVHNAVPRRGMVGIFNRSHYEDVLIVRVENLVPKPVWKKRYALINRFEQQLTAGGVIVLKFFLNISKDEQKRRLEDRLQDPAEHWKFRVSDLQARAKWDDYMSAYEDALRQCSTKDAPWYIIPGNKKWYRDLVISQILVDKLASLDLKWPPLEAEAQGITIG